MSNLKLKLSHIQPALIIMINTVHVYKTCKQDHLFPTTWKLGYEDQKRMKNISSVSNFPSTSRQSIIDAHGGKQWLYGMLRYTAKASDFTKYDNVSYVPFVTKLTRFWQWGRQNGIVKRICELNQGFHAHYEYSFSRIWHRDTWLQLTTFCIFLWLVVPAFACYVLHHFLIILSHNKTSWSGKI